MVTEMSGVQFDLKSQVCDFRPKLHVQLQLYYTHFEITQFFVNINIYLMFTSGKPVFLIFQPDGLKKTKDVI